MAKVHLTFQILIYQLLLLKVVSDVRIDTIINQYESQPSFSSNVAFHIRLFLQSEDGQYYLNAKDRYLSGAMAAGSPEFFAWRDRLVQACPNFSRLQQLSETGVIATSFPFLVKPANCWFCDDSTLGSTAAAAIAFSSKSFPWYQMLSNIEGLSLSLKSSFPPTTTQDAGRCVKVYRSPIERTAVAYFLDEPFEVKSHTWGVDTALDDSLTREDKAVFARIVAGLPYCDASKKVSTVGVPPKMETNPSVMAASPAVTIMQPFGSATGDTTKKIIPGRFDSEMSVGSNATSATSTTRAPIPSTPFSNQTKPATKPVKPATKPTSTDSRQTNKPTFNDVKRITKPNLIPRNPSVDGTITRKQNP